LKKSLFITLLGIVVFVSACGRLIVTVTPTVPVATASPVPTATSTALPGKVIFVQSSSFVGDINSIQTTVADQAASSGLLFETRETIQPADITSDWKVVLLLSAPDNLNELLTSSPQTRFVVVTPDELQASTNLNVIRIRPEKLAFLAGYITELVSDDWRGAGLLASDGKTSNEELQAFVNGGQYWCGTCSPAHPPYVLFPLYSTQPSNADWTTWQAGVDQLIANRLSDIYISNQAASAELLAYLAGKGIKLIGVGTPSQEILGNWVTTITWNISDPIKQHWPEIVSNQSGQSYDAALMLTNVNSEWMTVGRLRLVEEVAAALQQGLVDPLNVP
jgi:hypothetical protein